MTMKNAGLTRLLILLNLVIVFTGCVSGKTIMDSYVLKDGVLAGDAGKGIPPVRSIVIWPLGNAATGAKAKGIEVKITNLFADKFYLNSQFDVVVIINEERSKDLLTRAGEELGLKRKPKDLDGGLVATKVGELTGGDAFFIGVINDYDEEKVDKTVSTVAGGLFALVDAREGAYADLDSFTPPKFLWRANVKQTSKETLVTGRRGLDDTIRKMVDEVVTILISDVSSAQSEERSFIDKEIARLSGESSKYIANEEFDKAVEAWNEVLRIDPGNTEATGKIEEIQALKKEAEERKRLEALREEIEGLANEARSLEESGDLEGALAKWEEILKKDQAQEEAGKKIQEIKAGIAEEKSRSKDTEISSHLYGAQKSFSEQKYMEAVEAAGKVLEIDPENEKAQALIQDSNARLREIKARESEAGKAAEEAVEIEEEVIAPEPIPPQKEVEKPREAPQKKPDVSEKAAGETPELAEIRERAMGYFDREEYSKSRDEWRKLLELSPDDAQAREMLETVEMLINALQ